MSAKYFAENGKSFMLSQKVSAMQKAYDLIGDGLQKKHRNIYRMVKGLSYKKPAKKVATAKTPMRKSRSISDFGNAAEDVDILKLIYGEPPQE